MRADVHGRAPGPRGVAERDESSGLQAFKYGGWRRAVGEIQHAARRSGDARRARGDQTVASRVGQTAARGPGCCPVQSALQIARERWAVGGGRGGGPLHARSQPSPSS